MTAHSHRAMHPTDAPHLAPELLGELLDGRLPDEERARALAHLDACARCHAERDALAAVIGIGASLRSAARVPAEVWDAVVVRTIHERPMRQHVLRAMRGPLLLGAVLLAVVSAWIGVVVGRRLEARDAAARVPAAERMREELRAMREQERRALEEARRVEAAGRARAGAAGGGDAR